MYRVLSGENVLHVIVGLQFSAPSCNHFDRHCEWKKLLATKIAVKVTNLETCIQHSCASLFPRNS